MEVEVCSEIGLHWLIYNELLPNQIGFFVGYPLHVKLTNICLLLITPKVVQRRLINCLVRQSGLCRNSDKYESTFIYMNSISFFFLVAVEQIFFGIKEVVRFFIQ